MLPPAFALPTSLALECTCICLPCACVCISAALANLAPHSDKVHAYTAQKMLQTLHSLHLKHARLSAKLRQLSSSSAASDAGGAGAADNAGAAGAQQHQQHPQPGLALAAQLDRVTGLLSHYEQCMGVLCEALTAMCAPGVIGKNLNGLYALIHDR